MFLDPHFLWVARISAIRVHLTQLGLLLIFACILRRTSSHKMRGFGSKMGEGVVRCLLTTNSFLLFVFLRLCLFWWKSIKKCESDSTDTRTEANWLYSLSHAICYSYGTELLCVGLQTDRKTDHNIAAGRVSKPRLVFPAAMPRRTNQRRIFPASPPHARHHNHTRQTDRRFFPWVGFFVLTEQTDIRTDGRTPDRCITAMC